LSVDIVVMGDTKMPQRIASAEYFEQRLAEIEPQVSQLIETLKDLQKIKVRFADIEQELASMKQERLKIDADWTNKSQDLRTTINRAQSALAGLEAETRASKARADEAIADIRNGGLELIAQIHHDRESAKVRNQEALQSFEARGDELLRRVEANTTRALVEVSQALAGIRAQFDILAKGLLERQGLFETKQLQKLDEIAVMLKLTRERLEAVEHGTKRALDGVQTDLGATNGSLQDLRVRLDNLTVMLATESDRLSRAHMLAMGAVGAGLLGILVGAIGLLR
jgi:chromosome segregation ATPase